MKNRVLAAVGILSFGILAILFHFPLRADSDDPPQIATLEEWQRLSTDQKVEALNQAQTQSEEVDMSELENSRLKAAIEKAAADLADKADQGSIESDLDNMETIFTIGEPTLSDWVEVFAVDSQTVAVRLTLWQQGGNSPDDTTAPQKHYSTEDAAEADGMDVSADVSWQLHSYFEYVNGELRPLKIDIYDEGGFSWTGW